MSIKVHDGYELPAGSDVFEVVRSLDRGLRELHEKLVLQALVTTVLAYRQHQVLGSFDPFLDTAIQLSPYAPEARVRAAVELMRGHDLNPLLAAQGVLRVVGLLDEDHHTAPEVSLRMQVTLLRNTAGNHRIYALLGTDRQEYRDAFMRITGASDFSWWDNTDRPQGVEQASWALREMVWTKLLAVQPVTRQGLSWQLPSSGFELAQVMETVRPRLVRALPRTRCDIEPDQKWSRWLSHSR